MCLIQFRARMRTVGPRRLWSYGKIPTPPAHIVVAAESHNLSVACPNLESVDEHFDFHTVLVANLVTRTLTGSLTY